MSFTKINLDEQASLEFELAIEGVRDNVSEIRFVVEGEDYKLGFNGSYTNGVLTVDIPVLENVLSPGDKRCYLEVVADQKLFVPLKDTIEFVAPIRVESKQPSKKTVKEEVSVSVGSVSVTATAKPEVAKEEPLVEEVGDFEKICKDKKYTLAENKTHIFAKNKDGMYVGAKSKSGGKHIFFEPVNTIKEALGGK